MRIARVFPRRTNATPIDEFTFTDTPPLLTLPEIDEVHISVAFTYDLQRAEWLAEQWEVCGVPVKMGGPAFNEPGGEFVPGMYLKPGYVITSRGCPNHCWFCAVPKREGYQLRELPITEGYNVLDDNLLACSHEHIRAVFDMLEKQTERPMFTGGLEARLLKPWHAQRLKEIKTKRLYMAYDTPDDYEPLVAAGKMLLEAGFTKESHTLACYVLIGYRGDTFEKAEKRLNDTIKAGFVPYAMLYRDEEGKTDPEWGRFQRLWARPAIIAAREKDEIEKAAHPDGGRS
jgi:hypothetical protein